MDHFELDDVIIIGTVFLSLLLLLRKQGPPRKPRRRRFKRRPINRDRKIHGFYQVSFLPMKRSDPEMFFKYTRMKVESFNKLLKMITPLIKKQRQSDGICPEERLAMTLHFFSQGSTIWTIAWKYKVGHSTVHYTLVETAEAIWKVLNKEYLRAPSSEEEWEMIAEGFYNQWNFPNCLGALDGKHIQIQAPGNSGSQFFNYKKTFSIVLMASCDSNYFFKLVDIGAYGSESDGGGFSQSVFGKKFDMGDMHVPPPQQLPNTNIISPFTLVADEAFPLKNYIMRPYPGKNLDNKQRIFNYRLSRARRTIENAFGILVNRWRLLRNMIDSKVENIDTYVKAIICLHNFVKSENEDIYCPEGFVDTDKKKGTWRDEVKPLKSIGRTGSNRGASRNYNCRDTLKEYFSSPAGEVPWQNKVLEVGIDIQLNH